MNVSDFDFYLPPELIAQTPLKERDASRLLVTERWGNRGGSAVSGYCRLLPGR